MIKTYSYTSGDHIVDIDVTLDTHVNIDFEKGTKGTFVCNIFGEGNLDLKVNFQAHSDWSFLWLNRSDTNLVVKEHVQIDKDTHIKMNYGELSQGSHTKDSTYEFIGERSDLELKGASIVSNTLKWDLKAIHHAKHSIANMDNHAIVLDGGKLNFEVTGMIDKGYSKSETHQMTRIMNLGSKLDAVVFPKLLIDENDVAASHAATVGQPNEDHIYYLQSRGIDRDAALKLLIMGYLLPITSDIENMKIKEELIEEIEKKVSLQWI